MLLGECGEYITHNTKIKKYPDGFQKFVCASRRVFKEPGWEIEGDTEKKKTHRVDCSHPDDYSLRRAKDKIYDIVRLNTDLCVFCTLTFDPKRLDSKSSEAVKDAIQHFRKSAVKRFGLKYIFVAEYHKDGKIHIHGLINNVLPIVDSGTRDYFGKPLKIDTIRKKGDNPDNFKVVYNIPQWKYGFSTAYILDRSDADTTTAYITKTVGYLSKDSQKIFGNIYLAGGDITRDPPVQLTDMDFDELPMKQYFCKAINTAFKYWAVTSDGLIE